MQIYQQLKSYNFFIKYLQNGTRNSCFRCPIFVSNYDRQSPFCLVFVKDSVQWLCQRARSASRKVFREAKNRVFVIMVCFLIATKSLLLSRVYQPTHHDLRLQDKHPGRNATVALNTPGHVLPDPGRSAVWCMSSLTDQHECLNPEIPNSLYSIP